MTLFIEIAKDTLMITAFVAVMMLVIEYINVQSRGIWQEKLRKQRVGQYILAAILGCTPGCLGAFAVVAMYSHRSISLGAVVTAMIATSGDESFVMFSMIPKTALYLTVILFFAGILAGAITDRVLGARLTARLSCDQEFTVHLEEQCHCFPLGKLLEQWKHCSAARGTLTISVMLFLLAVTFGQLGPEEWNWIRISLITVSAVALFIVTTVPDHFLDEHLWRHVMCKHVPRIFLWTSGSLLVMHLLINQWQMDRLVREGQWIILIIAGLIGLIPESGPHLIFVTMFAKGLVPFSVLLTSSIVQDGHGMIPLLAHSRRAFILIKLINFLTGIAIGAIMMSVENL